MSGGSSYRRCSARMATKDEVILVRQIIRLID